MRAGGCGEGSHLAGGQLLAAEADERKHGQAAVLELPLLHRPEARAPAEGAARRQGSGVTPALDCMLTSQWCTMQPTQSAAAAAAGANSAHSVPPFCASVKAAAATPQEQGEWVWGDWR